MPQINLRIASLNIGRLFHLCPAASIDFLMDNRWDVVLVQDAYRSIVESTEFKARWPIRHFEAMTNHFKKGGLREEVGIGIFTRLPLISRSAHAYVRHLLPVGDLDGISLAPNGNANAKDLNRLRETESRLVLFAELMVGETIVKIGTTHGPYRPGGMVDDILRQEMCRFIDIVSLQPGDLVIAGDFNTARDGEIYRTFVDAGLRDCMPREIKNTIDWKVRGKEGCPDLVLDGVYTKGESLRVSNVQVHPGVSDHYGLSFTVTNK